MAATDWVTNTGNWRPVTNAKHTSTSIVNTNDWRQVNMADPHTLEQLAQELGLFYDQKHGWVDILGRCFNQPGGEVVGMTPEGKVKHAVKTILLEHDCYYFMPVQNGMGTPGLDFHCAVRNAHDAASAFAIETKAPGKKLTARQKKTKESMERAGVKVFVIDGTDYSELELWIAAQKRSA